MMAILYRARSARNLKETTMPDKQLTLTIPEPVDGKCSEECPCRYTESDGYITDCSAGLNSPRLADDDPLVPGEGCPQYQDAHAILVKRYQELGFTEATRFPEEYTLLIHPRSLQKVRVYTTGKIFVTDPHGCYYEDTPCT